MVNLKRNKKKEYQINCLELAFEKAKINLGSTSTNPSVGCVVEKNGSIISSGFTSINGRPHAEFIALNKNINFKGADIYTTLEPCSHHGMTPPCTNIIKKKGIRNVFYSISDFDKRSKNKSTKILKKEGIIIKKNLLKKKGLEFYKSYFYQHQKKIPLIDAKIAISKDYFTSHRKKKWITNSMSRNTGHLLRSNYNCIISTSKTINADNAVLNCRIDGFEKKNPDLVIIDRNLKIKKKLFIFNLKIRRKILLFTTKNDKKKIYWLKKRKVKVFLLDKMENKYDYKNIFNILFKQGYSRIFVETGLIFLNFLIKNKLLNNIYVFQSNQQLKNNGYNCSNEKFLKNIIRLKKKMQIFLFGESLFKERLK